MLKNIGGLWQKSGQKGDYFSGSVEIDGKKVAFLVFRNSKKQQPRQPDWTIMIDDGQPKPPTNSDLPPF